MDRMVFLLSAGGRTSDLFVIWKARHRICHVSVSKKDSLTIYSIRYVDKYYVPYVFSWFRVGHYSQSVKPATKSTLPRYMVFDGHRLEPWSVLQKESDYKQTKYLKDIYLHVHSEKWMKKWISSHQTRYKIMYQTLLFLARSGINPEQTLSITRSGFSDAIKKKVVADATARCSKEITFRGFRILLVKDVVGLWTVDLGTKTQVLKDIDCINSYDIEHVVSNSYGADNSERINGVLLDSKVNRGKGNTMLFLVPDHVLKGIKNQYVQQAAFLRSLLPWYTRIWSKLLNLR